MADDHVGCCRRQPDRDKRRWHRQTASSWHKHLKERQLHRLLDSQTKTTTSHETISLGDNVSQEHHRVSHRTKHELNQIFNCLNKPQLAAISEQRQVLSDSNRIAACEQVRWSLMKKHHHHHHLYHHQLEERLSSDKQNNCQHVSTTMESNQASAHLNENNTKPNCFDTIEAKHRVTSQEELLASPLLSSGDNEVREKGKKKKKKNCKEFGEKRQANSLSAGGSQKQQNVSKLLQLLLSRSKVISLWSVFCLLVYAIILLLATMTTIRTSAYQLTNNLIANNLPPKFLVTANSGQASNSEIVVRVKEGAASIGKLIHTLRGEDPDDDPLTFGVLGSMASDLLRIENVPRNQANVYLRKELDRETTESYQVVITLTDGKLGRGNWITKSMLIIVEDVNDNYPVFGPHPTTISIREDVKVPLVIETLEATDQDEGRFGQVIYKLDELDDNVGGTSNSGPRISSMFAIETIDGRGVLSLISPLDYEQRSLYQLRVLAVDRAIEHERLTASTSILISVVDCEDQPPMFTFVPSITRIPESLPVGSPVVRVAAIDGDRGVGNQIQYKLVSVNGQESGLERSLFSMNPESGQISVAHELNREATLESSSSLLPLTLRNKLDSSQPGSYVLQVRASEIGSSSKDNSVSTELTIILTDVNDETPTFNQANYYGELLENSPADSLVSFIAGQPMALGDTGFSSSIGQGNSQISAKVVDRDQGTNGTFTLHLEGEHGHLFDIWPHEATNEASFMIKVSNSKASTALDYETIRSFQFTIVAREKYNNNNNQQLRSNSAKMTVYLKDTNDNYPQFESELIRVEVPENAIRGMHICHVKAEDADSGIYGTQGIRYTEIRGEKANKFKLDPITGIVTLKSSDHGFDRETVAQHHLIIEARDSNGSGNGNTTQVLIVVMDVNDQRPKFVLDQYEAFIYENELDFQSPLQVQALDGDAPNTANSRITYSIVGGDPHQNFTIDPQTGRIKVKSSLVAIPTLTLVRPGQHHQHHHHPQTVGSAPANSGGSQEEDGGRGSESDIVLEQASGGGGNSVAQATGLDFERIAQKRDETRQFNLTVRATDSGLPEPLFDTTHVLILVHDKNDHAPIFTRNVYSKSIREDAKEGSQVIQVLAQDGDHSPTNSKITYRISSGASDKFVIDSETGLVSVANGANLDIDRVVGGQRRTNYLLNVVAFDGSFGTNQKSSSALVNITIIDVNNKPPEFVSLGTNRIVSTNSASIGSITTTMMPPSTISQLQQQMVVYVNEDAPYGLIVTRVVAVDLDSSAELRYSINYARSEARNEDMVLVEQSLIKDLFSIEPTDGTIKVAKQLDRELFDQVKLRLQVEDIAAQTPDQLAYAHLLIKITDVNDNRPAFKKPVYKAVVNENSISGTSVITLTADDRDLNKTLKYSLDGPDEMLRLIRINPRSGDVTVNDKIDRELYPLINVTVRAEDYGYPQPLTGTTQLLITVRDENDNNPMFLNSTHQSTRHQFQGQPFDSMVGFDQDQAAQLPRNHNMNHSGTSTYRQRSLGPYRFETTAMPPDLGASDLSPLESGGHLPLLAPGATAQIREDAPIGFQVAYVRAEDADVGNNGRVTYLIDATSSGGKFRIDRDSGIISVAGALDRETSKQYSLIIEACDNYDLGYSTGESRRAFTKVNIQITDVNDNAPIISTSLQTSTTAMANSNGNTDGSEPSPWQTNAAGSDHHHRLAATYPTYDDIMNSPGPYDLPLAECLMISEFQQLNEPILTVTATDADDPNTPNSQIDLAIVNNLPQNELFSLVRIPSSRDHLTTTTTRASVVPTTLDYNLGFGDSMTLAETGTSTQSGEASSSSPPSSSSSSQVDEDMADSSTPSAASPGSRSSGIRVDESELSEDDVDSSNLQPDLSPNGPTRRMMSVTKQREASRSLAASGRPKRSVPVALSSQSLDHAISGNFYAPTTNLRSYQQQQQQLAARQVPASRGQHLLHPLPQDTQSSSILTTSGPSQMQVAASSSSFNSVKATRQAYHQAGGAGSIATSEMGEQQAHIVVSQPLKERVGNYTILVRATDRGQPSLSSVRRINICVQDVNNHAPVFIKHPLNHTIRIMENATVGTFVTQLEASDSDHGLNGEIQYSLKQTNIQSNNNDWQSFKIDRLSGKVTTAKTFNRQVKKYYTLRVQASDFGRPTSLSSDIDINIMIVNSGQYQPEFDIQTQSLQFTENVSPGIEWFTLLPTTNLDDDPALINANSAQEKPASGSSGSTTMATAHWLATPCYFIIDSDDQGQVFQLDRYSHRISNRKVLDRELKANYTLLVQATNNCNKPPVAPIYTRTSANGAAIGSTSAASGSSSAFSVSNMSDNQQVSSDREHKSNGVSEDLTASSTVGTAIEYRSSDGATSGVGQTETRVRLARSELETNSVGSMGSPTQSRYARSIDAILSRRQTLGSASRPAGNQTIGLEESSELDTSANGFNAAAVEALLAADKTLLKVFIKIKDVNDNAPRFTQRVYTGGITTEADFGTIFMIVQAIDVDANNQIVYSLVKPIKRNLVANQGANKLVGAANNSSSSSTSISTTPVTTSPSTSFARSPQNLPSRQRRAATSSLQQAPNQRQFENNMIQVDGDASTNSMNDIPMNEGDDLFVINPQTGEISLNFDPQKHMKGYFEFEVMANDTDGLFDSAKVFIYLLRQDQRVKFVLRLTPQELRQRLNKFRSVFGNITGAIVNIDSYKYYENHDGTVDKKKTSLYLHFVDPSDNTIIEVDKVLTLIDQSIEYLDELYKEFHVLSSEAAHLPLSSSALIDPIDQIRTGLMGITSFLALILVLVIALCLNQRTRYERQLKAATVSAFSSSPLHLDPDYHSQTNLPNTNLHSQDPNPIWINGFSEQDWLGGNGNGGVGGGNLKQGAGGAIAGTVSGAANGVVGNGTVGVSIEDADYLSSGNSDINSLSGVNCVNQLHYNVATTATPRDSLDSSQGRTSGSNSGSSTTTNDRQMLCRSTGHAGRQTPQQQQQHRQQSNGTQKEHEIVGVLKNSKQQDEQLHKKSSRSQLVDMGNTGGLNTITHHSTFGAFKEVTIYTEHNHRHQQQPQQFQQQQVKQNNLVRTVNGQIQQQQQQQQHPTSQVNKIASQFNAKHQVQTNRGQSQVYLNQHQQQQRIIVHSNGADVNQGIIKASTKAIGSANQITIGGQLQSQQQQQHQHQTNGQLNRKSTGGALPASAKMTHVANDGAGGKLQGIQQQMERNGTADNHETNLSKLSILNLETTEL